MTGAALKWIALFSMLLDHIGAFLFPSLAMRAAGRLAFPIFCFLLTEGVQKTSSRGRYATRLLVFAVLSELPYRLLCGIPLLSPGTYNVLFTLLLGFGAVACWQRLSRRPWLGALCVIGIAAAAELLGCDYGAYGIMTIFCFALFRSQTRMGLAAFSLLTACYALTGGAFLQLFALLAAPLLALYNGRRGTMPKYLFYVFYPLHMLLLAALLPGGLAAAWAAII